MKRNIKVGERIYYECLDNTIGTAIVTKIEPRTYYWDNGKRYNFNMLSTGPYTAIEDYNTLAPSNPKVKAYIKEIKTKKRHLSTKHLYLLTPIEKTFQKRKERLVID